MIGIAFKKLWKSVWWRLDYEFKSFLKLLTHQQIDIYVENRIIQSPYVIERERKL